MIKCTEHLDFILINLLIYYCRLFQFFLVHFKAVSQSSVFEQFVSVFPADSFLVKCQDRWAEVTGQRMLFAASCVFRSHVLLRAR